jgi:uncharacterized protein YggE
MFKKTFIISSILLAALFLGACGSATPAGSGAPARTLSVNGIGEVYLTPDIAYISIGVHNEEESASRAVQANNAKTQSVINALKNVGVDEKDIRTSNFSIWPNSQYGPDGQQQGVTYMVDNSVFVTVRDLQNLGELLDSVVQSGANSINSIQFDVEDKTEAIKQARAVAVADAQVQAAELADAASLKLGEVQSIGFYDAAPVASLYSPGKGGGGAAEAAASVPIQPGQLSLAVTVSVTYELR